MSDRIKAFLLAAVILMFVFVATRPNHPGALPSMDQGHQTLYDLVARLNPTMEVFAQGPPQAGVPVNPSHLYGAAFTSYATTAGAGPMSMQIYKAAGNISVPSTGINTMYIYFASCDNNSASTVSLALLKDGSATVTAIPCPPAGVANPGRSFNPPLRITSGVTPTMTATAAASTLYYFVSGYLDQR